MDEVKNCEKCGNEMAYFDKFCPLCGTKSKIIENTSNRPFCPNCGSVNTWKIGGGIFAVASFIVGSCMLWMPIIGLFLAFVAFILAIVFGISTLVPNSKQAFQCTDCKKWFVLDKKQKNEP